MSLIITARRFFSWMLNALHITSGAFVLILITLLFIVAVYKIDHNAIDKQAQVDRSVCHTVAGFNVNDRATKIRIQGSIDRFRAQARAEQEIASIWRYARRHQPTDTPNSQKRLVTKLIRAQDTLAREDRAAAADLQTQLAGVRPIILKGC